MSSASLWGGNSNQDIGVWRDWRKCGGDYDFGRGKVGNTFGCVEAGGGTDGREEN